MLRTYSATEIEKQAFDIFHFISHPDKTADDRKDYYLSILRENTEHGLAILEKTRLFIEAKRLVKLDANRTEYQSLMYPGNQQDSQGIREVDERRAELENDTEVTVLAELRHELGEFIRAQKARMVSVTTNNLHQRQSSKSATDAGLQSINKKPKH